MNKSSKIYLAGNTGLVGSAITRKLTSEGFTNLVFTPFPEYDLRNQQQVIDFFEKEKTISQPQFTVHLSRITVKYDAIVVAVAHKPYLDLDEAYFKSIMDEKGVLVDVKGVYRKIIKTLDYWSL